MTFVEGLNRLIGSQTLLLIIRSLDLATHTSLSPIRRGFAPTFMNYKKVALDSQPQLIKLMVYIYFAFADTIIKNE
jgi:hypothetical protein